MKTQERTVNIMLVISAIFSGLALLMHLLMYYSAQNYFISRLLVGRDDFSDVHVTYYAATVCALLLTAVYLTACIVTIKAKDYSTGWGICLIVGVFQILVNIVDGLFMNMKALRDASLMSVEYLTAFSALRSVREYLEKPLYTCALIFLCIAFGMLCILKDYEKEA